MLQRSRDAMNAFASGREGATATRKELKALKTPYAYNMDSVLALDNAMTCGAGVKLSDFLPKMRLARLPIGFTRYEVDMDELPPFIRNECPDRDCRIAVYDPGNDLSFLECDWSERRTLWNWLDRAMKQWVSNSNSHGGSVCGWSWARTSST